MKLESLATRIVRVTAAALVAALVATGLVTGGLVHAQARRAVDAQLLAAAQAFATGGGVAWELEHRQSGVRVWVVEPDDSTIPLDRRSVDGARSRPVWFDLGDERVALLVVERENRPTEAEEEHRIIAAATPRVRLADTVSGVLAPYAFGAAFVAILALGSLRRSVRYALAPLDRARAEAEQAAANPAHARLSEEGPAEVRALLVAMNELLARLDDASAAQARFTAEAAHELRTPVTVLLGEIDVAMRRERDVTSLRETLASVREEAARLGRLVEGLLALARIDSGQAEADREATDAGRIIADAVDRERRTLEAAGCTLSIELPADPLFVTGNRTLLATALANLLRNAAVHAPGAPVHIDAKTGARGVQFSVADAGPGVPPERREALFDRFARGGEARRGGVGLGLGLPLAREIARRHGGDCVIRDAERGCRVELWVG